MGIPLSKHADVLKMAHADSAKQHVFVTQPSSPGVMGTYVHLAQAQDFAKRLRVDEGSKLLQFLRSDLFDLVSHVILRKRFVADGGSLQRWQSGNSLGRLIMALGNQYVPLSLS